ncbi:girdin-like [Malaya genurostris]|uniref:girdin-like n=1 Tax=Malaya genurostris TaxID=325434 RepID=UPI0026F382FD|nr:girdin-like [Malaya genurostris]
MSTKEFEKFLNGPLISWIGSCLPRHEKISEYEFLLDGSILHTVYLQIDPEPQYHPIKSKNEDDSVWATSSLQNLDIVVRNLQCLYDEEFNQIILVLPDSEILCQSPESLAGLEHMKLLITLLLGAAVQCPNKEIFIARIKELDLNTQLEIVDIIKQVTDSEALVLTREALEQLSPEIMCQHIARLVKERDQYHNKWISTVESALDLTDSCSSKILKQHSSTMVDLSDYKFRLRKLRQELEEKSEVIMEIKEELDDKSNQFEKLRIESEVWQTEAKRAAVYRDEIDILRERGERADRLEVEVLKLREKLRNAEYYRTRVDELREDNRILSETKEMIEEQLLHSRKRSDQVLILEIENIKLKQMLDDFSQERDKYKSRLQDLLEEKDKLQLAINNLLSGSDTVFQSNIEECISYNDKSLSVQLSTDAQSRAIKMELENMRLLAALNNHQESSLHDSHRLKKEKTKLTLRVEQAQENNNRYGSENVDLENVLQNALNGNKNLQNALEGIQQIQNKQNEDFEQLCQADFDRQIESLTRDNERFQSQYESVLRKTIDLERSLDCKMEEIQFLNEKCEEYKNQRNEHLDLHMKVATLEKLIGIQAEDLKKYKEKLEQKENELNETVINLNENKKDIDKLLVQLNKISQVEAEKILLLQQIEDRKQAYATLLQDKFTLECLHEQLTNEYESLKSNREIVKNNIREYKVENNDLKERCLVLEKQLEDYKLQCASMKDDVTNLRNLKSENSELKDDFRCLFTNSERLQTELKNVEVEYRFCRSENNRLKLQNTELYGDLSNKIEQLMNLEIEYTKLHQRFEIIVQMNSNLDTDRRTLMEHVSQVLAQYNELLLHSLEDKQHYHDEEKNFTDYVNNLLRQKEKLEEKIMDHYRKLDNCTPKKKTFGLNFVKKVRKAGTELINRVPNRNRRSCIDEPRMTLVQFVVGSETDGNVSDNSTEESIPIATDANLSQ